MQDKNFAERVCAQCHGKGFVVVKKEHRKQRTVCPHCNGKKAGIATK